MKKRNHITFGAIFVLLFILILAYLNIEIIEITAASLVLVATITIFYSLLPDIDHKNSTITWWFFGIGILGLLAGILELVFQLRIINPITLLVLSTLFLVFTFLAVNLFSHRGIIHSIPIGILAVTPLYFVFHGFAFPLIAYVAWHSHLVGDGYLLKFK